MGDNECTYGEARPGGFTCEGGWGGGGQGGG